MRHAWADVMGHLRVLAGRDWYGKGRFGLRRREETQRGPFLCDGVVSSVASELERYARSAIAIDLLMQECEVSSDHFGYVLAIASSA
jgi:hypothetical protein